MNIPVSRGPKDDPIATLNEKQLARLVWALLTLAHLVTLFIRCSHQTRAVIKYRVPSRIHIVKEAGLVAVHSSISNCCIVPFFLEVKPDIMAASRCRGFVKADRVSTVSNIIARGQKGGLHFYCAAEQVTNCRRFLIVHIILFQTTRARSVFWLAKYSRAPIVLSDNLNCCPQLGDVCCLSELWLCCTCLLLLRLLSVREGFWHSFCCFFRWLLLNSSRCRVDYSILFGRTALLFDLIFHDYRHQLWWSFVWVSI